MHLLARGRIAIVAGAVLLVLGAITVFIPESARTWHLNSLDSQLRQVVPVITQLSPSRAQHDPDTLLSEVYAARVDRSTGSRSLIARALLSPHQSPQLPGRATDVNAPLEPQTVASRTGADEWQAALVTTRSAQFLIAIPIQQSSDHRSDAELILLRAISLAILATTGWYLLRLGIRPIREVTRVADAINSGDRSRRLSAEKSGTAAANLVQAFNTMLDEQHASEDRLRRFLSDASHELRTPVSAIGGFADLYRHGAVPPAELDDVMRRVGQESSRMRDLIEDMLLLARLDEGRPLAQHPVDLAALARDAALDASASHPSRSVSVSAPPHAVVLGDEPRLRQVISNLVNNALNHTADEVTIDVTSSVSAGTLAVADKGPGMSDETLARVFDRFWRGESMRASAGSGLGLAIVRSIVEAHRGTVTIESSPTSGTRACVTLPHANGHH